MIPLNELLLFTGACFLLVITPGPNMLYLLSRSVCQGRAAGIVSLFGVLLGFSVHMLGAAFGLSAIFLAIPAAYEALRWAGVIYLLWLAWGSLKPGAQSPFAMRELPIPKAALRDEGLSDVFIGYRGNWKAFVGD